MKRESIRVQNVYLVARDVNRLAAFYDEVFSIPMKFRDGDSWVQYDANNCNFSLSCLEEANPAETGAVVVFEVDEFDEILDNLEKAGGKVLALRDMGRHGSVLSFSDPEENIVQLFRRASRQAESHNDVPEQ